jgi:predicted extracellular nuclease
VGCRLLAMPSLPLWLQSSAFTMKRKANPSSVRRNFSVLLLITTLLSTAYWVASPRPVQGLSSGLVISQLYGGGGNAGSTFKNDFIELFNRGTTTVSVAGWSVQYAAATGTSWQVTNLSGSIAPGQYYLVQEAAGAGGTTNLPPPDATGSIAMSATAAKVALVNTTTTLTGTCPTGASIIDLVGYGTANCFEGAAVAALTNTTAALRALGGCTETDNNASDFATGAPNPRNTSSALNPCAGDAAPAVASTVPINGAINVAVNATITVNFSEAVNVTGSWFSISGSSSGPHTAAVSGGPMNFTLDPDTDFATSETVTVTIFASQVTDQDAIDPPDNMAANFVFSFTTVAPPPPFKAIHEIQGATHTSPFISQMVSTSGIVTAKRANGFYIQDPVPDSDEATSEGLFIFTSSAPTVSVGDAVNVSGTVQEFRAGGPSSANLTNTELSLPIISVTSSGNSLPPPIIIGISGRIPPSMVIEDDSSPDVETSNVFDPASDGIDFYESLENMRVQINNAVVVGPSVAFGEIPVVSDDGANASVRTTRGGVVIRSNDFNPERVFLDDEITSTPTVVVGDHFTGPIVGVMDYSFGNFKLEVTSSPVAVSGGLSQEVTTLPGADQLAIATFNVENLDPNDPPSKFTDLAGIIVNNLKSPDLIAVEEIQDNNGATNNGEVDATTTYNLLIAAIQTAGGPTYQFRQINPVNNQDGGEPGGNIRVGFLFRTDRGLAFIDRPGGTSTGATTVVNGVSGPELSFSPGRIDPTNAAFNSSRKPLAGEFTFNCRKLFVIANHFISKGGDDPLFGRFQPPTLSSEVQRVQQAQVVNNFVDSVLALDPNAAIVTLGDLNDFEFSNPLSTLKGGVLHDLIESLPQSERYTYVFDGNSQAIDHILLSDSLFNGVPAFDYDVVHVNSEFVVRTSDHEPQVVKLTIPDTPPEIVCPASIVAGNDPGFCSAVVNFDAPTVSDNCPGVGTPMCTPPSGSTFPKGTTTVNCSVTDSNSSSSSCSFTVTVNDTQSPVIGSCPPNQTVIENPAGSGGAVATYTAPGASDNCEATVNCAPASGSIFPVGTTTVVCTATDPSNNSASCSFTVTVLNAVQLSPAKVWIGLKSSDDVGTNFDLLAEVLKNGSVVGTGQSDNVPGGSSGFNNAVLRTISLALSGPVSISTGDTLSFRLSVRITAVGGHRSGTARLWYNGAAIDTGPTRDAGSRFGATIGGTPADYFLRSGFVLQTTAGSSKLFIDVFADRLVGGNPFKPFGTWSKTF